MSSPRSGLASLLLIALLVSPKLPWLSAQPATPKTASLDSQLPNSIKGPWSLPTQGFSLSLAQGWVAEKGGFGHRVLTCALPNKSGAIKQIVLVEMGVSEAATLRGHAATLAEPGKSQFLGGERQLDGHPALVLKLSGDNSGLSKKWAQQRAIVTRQGKQTFTIAIFADAGEKIDSTVASIFKGWKWQPFADPTRYLQLSQAPASFANGRMKIRVPNIMQTVSVEPEMTMLGIKDARTGFLAFTLSVALISAQKSMELKTMRSNFVAGLKQRLDLKTAVAWQDFTGQPARTLSNFFSLPAEMEESGYRAVGSYGLVKMPNNQWAILTFTITGQEAKAQALYAATAQKILASVKLGNIKRP